jgi:hypothetical protein
MAGSAVKIGTGPRGLNLDGTEEKAGKKKWSPLITVICRLQTVHGPLVYNTASGAVYITA